MSARGAHSRAGPKPVPMPKASYIRGNWGEQTVSASPAEFAPELGVRVRAARCQSPVRKTWVQHIEHWGSSKDGEKTTLLTLILH